MPNSSFAISFGYRTPFRIQAMNLRALRYFVAIADAGSLTAASASIAIAQPALTRQLRELEADLGVQLLHRMPRGVRLTQAGVTLYESAQRMLAEAARVKQQLARHQDPKDVTVVLGASPTLARVLMPNLFESCQRSASGITLRAREAFTPTLLDWLERGMVDMAIVTNPEPGRSLTLHPLLGEPFALISHTSLRIGPIVSIGQLVRIPLLMTSLHRGIVERQLLPLGRQLNIQAEIDSVDSIRELVLRGQWATIMPISVFKEPRSSEGVVMSEVSGVQLNRLLVLATRIEPRTNTAIPAMQELIESEFAKLARRGIFSFTN
ncbi:MAG: LysR family transcriptional regulator [Comamonadaceae bacterium]|nr:MAG: LysR family transcriptional regulator [Comamonadaceae bacterium]